MKGKWSSFATRSTYLAIGLARLLDARLERTLGGLRRIVWLGPLLVWGWVVFDHAVFNHTAGRAGLSPFLKVLYALDGYGRLSTIVLCLLVVATIILERWLLHRGRWRTLILRLPVEPLKRAMSDLRFPAQISIYLLSIRSYLRERRGLSYGLYFYHQAKAPGKRRQEYLDGLAGALYLWKDLLQPSP
jgi:hypothetical protein